MPWFHGIAERNHIIQNPTTEEKIRLLGERLHLGPDSTVLDVASGRGGPAVILARDFGCRLTCVEWFDEFVAVARQRATVAGVDHLIEVVQADASHVDLGVDRFDAALCLGASFVYGGLVPTLARFEPAVHVGGHVAVGEVFWHAPPPAGVPDYGGRTFEQTFTTLDRTFPIVTVIGSSDDDWDRYATLRLLTVEDWLAEFPDDPAAVEIRAEHEASKDFYGKTRGRLGWAIFAGRKTQ